MGVHELYATTYSIFLFIVVIVVALVFGGGGALNVVEGGAWSSVRLAVSMLPVALLSWGVLLSFLTLQFRYFVPSLIGASALGLSAIGALVFGKFLPGLVASSSAILTYYTFDYSYKHADENPMKNIMMSTIAFLILLAQLLSTKPAPIGTFLFTASLLNDGLATLFGIATGLMGWLIVSAADSELLPYTGSPHTSTPRRARA
jgi:hypothetical protein